jgi:YfiR/HmsC-like
LKARPCLAALLAAALIAAPPGAPLAAQPRPPSEEAVKAAFLPKFARYVSWPTAAQPGPGTPFQLCVIGRDPFGGMLDAAAAGEQIEGRGVTVRRLPTAEGAGGCQLAFVQGAAATDTARLLGALRARPILTITDSRAGETRGMIHFTIVSGRVGFFIDEAAAAQRGLSISSRLLAIALGVRPRR